MAYTNFTLNLLKSKFGLQTDEITDYFADTPPAVLSSTLQDHLRKYVQRALNIGTEKARSELIITPMLLEVLEQFPRALGFFSGTEFSPDAERDLSGVCDYLLTLSPEQLTIEAPVVAVVEAKNENMRQGIVQCIAEMVAAQVFNQREGYPLPTVYGVVTTGQNWQFLRLVNSIAYIDRTTYYIVQPDKIVGILLAMLHEASANA